MPLIHDERQMRKGMLRNVSRRNPPPLALAASLDAW